jgi:ribokinase
MGVIVLGSINMDLVARAERLPQAGETLTGRSFTTAPGGKGANQAVASARLGAATRMIGAVGDDVFGARLRDQLHAESVDVTDVATNASQPSGVALIVVNDAAENTIIIIPGANGAIGAEALGLLDAALANAQVLLLQLEIPLPAVVAAAQAAHQRGVTVILDPAPALPLPDELLRAVDILTPNETEAAALAGFPIYDQADAERAAMLLIGRGARHVIVKMGSKGVYWTDGRTREFAAAYLVEPVDTVAAGDAFNGGLAVALAEARPLAEAIRWGLAAGALAVTKAGAQAAMPTRGELLALLGRQS